MSLVQKIGAKGIDVEIAKIQSRVYNTLITEYNWQDYNSYERVYLNIRKGVLIPELYTGTSSASNNEYRPIYFNDTVTAESYFIVDPVRSFGERFEATVGMVFQMNLQKMFPTIEHRPDEQAHEEVFTAMKTAVPGDIGETFISLATGIDDVYSGLDTTEIQATDMQPCHVFRYNFNLNFDFNC